MGEESSQPRPSPEPPLEAGLQGFQTTLWSVVRLAGEGASAASTAALERLCQSYWYPLYAYLRRRGQSPHDAQDLIQGYFEQLLERNLLQAVRQERGKFRWFLLSTLRRFAANEWNREHAAKRGGRVTLVSLDEETAEGRYRREIPDVATPETLYDQSWAMTLLGRAEEELRREYEQGGRGVLFERLKAFLPGDWGGSSYRDVGEELGMAEGAVKVAVHRLRRRFRDCLRGQIAQTVSTAAEVDEEIRQLFGVFRG